MTFIKPPAGLQHRSRSPEKRLMVIHPMQRRVGKNHVKCPRHGLQLPGVANQKNQVRGHRRGKGHPGKVDHFGRGVHPQRLATRQENDYPFQLGAVKIVPYALGEAANWGQDLEGNSLTRLYGQGGVRANLPLWSVDPAIQDDLFNIHGIMLSNGKLLVIAGAIIVMAALYYFMKTKIGTAMLAAAENNEVAQLQGINSKRIFHHSTL